MTRTRLVVSVTFLLTFFVALRAHIDTDTWWHLKAGEWMVQNGTILRMDLFSYTRFNEAWTYPSLAWISESLIYLVYKNIGIWALNFSVALFVTIAFIFVYQSMTGGVLLRSFVLLLAVITSGVYWAVRPYMFSFLFSAMTIWVLENFRNRRSNRLWLLPLIMLIWVNSHPGFAVGYLLFVIYLAGEVLQFLMQNLPIKWTGLKAGLMMVRPLIIIGLLMLIAGVINPSGINGLRYPFDTLNIDFLAAINEWQPPDFHSQSMTPFMLMIFLLFGALGASRLRMVPTEYLLLISLAYLSFTAARNVALFALITPIIITNHLAEPAMEFVQRLGLSFSSDPPARLNNILNWAIVLALAAGASLRVMQVGDPSLNEQKTAQHAPLGAIEYIQQEDLNGRLFNSYNWGGYLIWALPEYLVFIDGRTDLYSDGLLEEWLDVVNGDAGWQATLDRWDVQVVLIEPDRNLAKLLPYEGWQIVHQDKTSVLFVR